MQSGTGTAPRRFRHGQLPAHRRPGLRHRKRPTLSQAGGTVGKATALAFAGSAAAGDLVVLRRSCSGAHAEAPATQVIKAAGGAAELNAWALVTLRSRFRPKRAMWRSSSSSGSNSQTLRTAGLPTPSSLADGTVSSRDPARRETALCGDHQGGAGTTGAIAATIHSTDSEPRWRCGVLARPR